MGRPMSTSQDFVNWVCSDQLEPDYLKYLLVAEGEGLLRFASGAVHQTIYFPEAKAFFVCHPPPDEQRRVVRILDEAFAGIAAAQTNAQKNLQSARDLFESYLESVMRSKKWKWKTLGDLCDGVEYGSSAKSQREGLIPVLRMGNIQDAQLDWKELAYTNDKAEIAKYLLRPNDVLFNRTNSPELVGKTAIYKGERPAIFAGYLIRIRRKEDLLDGDFLNYFLNSHIALNYGKTVMSSSVNQANINGSKLKSYPIPAPPLSEQRTIVNILDDLQAETRRLASVYHRKLAAIEELKQSLLHQAFTGRLTARSASVMSSAASIARPIDVPQISTTDLHAGILAMAYQLHDQHGKAAQFTHVKAEKIAHMVEVTAGLDLDRTPVKDAAGPNDFPHLLKVEHRARRANYFDFKRGQSGTAYRVQRLSGFNRLLDRTREALGENLGKVEDTLNWMLRLTVQQAEIVATVYAAWNNLLLEGKSPDDDEIVYESRENWHPNKLKIDRQRFLNAVEWLRKEGVVPQGAGKPVAAKGGR